MSRIERCFKDLKSAGRKGVVPYIVAGDPGPEITVPMMHELVAQGADIIELGVPFSDPMAEGPVIQLAHERALVKRVGLRQVLAMVAEFRLRDDKTPVLLMGYCNPIEAMGYETFTKAAAVAGIDAVLTVDMPPEEVGEFGNMLAAVNIDNVLLVSLTTSHERMKHIVASARGFIYFVSLKGVTGAGNLDVSAVAKACAQLRDLSDLPIGVGFGIKDVNSAMAIGVEADAVVVGSALVDRMANIDLSLPLGSMLAEAASLIGDIRAGLDGVEQAE